MSSASANNRGTWVLFLYFLLTYYNTLWGLSWFIGLHWRPASPLPPAPIAFFCIPFLRDDSDIKVHKGLVYQALKQGRLKIPVLNSVYWNKNTEQTQTLPPKSIGYMEYGAGGAGGGMCVCVCVCVCVCERGNRKKRLRLFRIKPPISKMKAIGREGKKCQNTKFNNFSVLILWTVPWMWNISAYTKVSFLYLLLQLKLLIISIVSYMLDTFK